MHEDERVLKFLHKMLKVAGPRMDVNAVHTRSLLCPCAVEVILKARLAMSISVLGLWGLEVVKDQCWVHIQSSVGAGSQGKHFPSAYTLFFEWG